MILGKDPRGIIVSSSDHPNVPCEMHPGKRPGYYVCEEIVAGLAAIDRVVPSTDSKVGFVFCSGKCLRDTGGHDAPLICALCALEHGWVVPCYPNVLCSKHPENRPGYGVCSHIVDNGAAVGWVAPPTTTEAGRILCAEDETGMEVFMICVLCAGERGWLKS